MSYDGVYSFGVQRLGDLSGGIAAGCALRCGAHRVGTQREAGEGHQKGNDSQRYAQALPLSHKELEIEDAIGAEQERDGKQKHQHGDLSAVFKKGITRFFEGLD